MKGANGQRSAITPKWSDRQIRLLTCYAASLITNDQGASDLKRKVTMRARLLCAILMTFVVEISAQTVSVLHTFTGMPDGADPWGLVRSGNTLYGITQAGGSDSYGNGTVFCVNLDGSSYRILHTFSGPALAATNSDGEAPMSGLCVLGNTLFGTTTFGGANGGGTVFSVDTNGTFATVYNFPPNFYALGTLILSDGTLYGTSENGGMYGLGAVFSLNTNGSGFTLVHSFTGDGANPYSGLVQSGDTLYGTTHSGGTGGSGTVFSVKTNGASFSLLHSFTNGFSGTNADGISPDATLTLSGEVLYGTTLWGSLGFGVVFSIHTDGTGFAVLHSFAGVYQGKTPLALSGNTLYGGIDSVGSLFSVNIDGTGFLTHTNQIDPAGGIAGPLVVISNSVCGTSSSAILSFSFAPQLSINHLGTNVILLWPTNYAGFDYTGYSVQSTTNLGSSVWLDLPAPVITNGQYTVTNPISGTTQFFRLSQ
jgi:uncharacterized repeat protein (TIGR03803 family)